MSESAREGSRTFAHCRMPTSTLMLLGSSLVCGSGCFQVISSVASCIQNSLPPCDDRATHHGPSSRTLWNLPARAFSPKRVMLFGASSLTGGLFEPGLGNDSTSLPPVGWHCCSASSVCDRLSSAESTACGAQHDVKQRSTPINNDSGAASSSSFHRCLIRTCRPLDFS